MMVLPSHKNDCDRQINHKSEALRNADGRLVRWLAAFRRRSCARHQSKLAKSAGARVHDSLRAR